VPLLLLEIGCEELPASACREAEAQLPRLAEVHLGRASSVVYVGPRRLAVLVDGVSAEPEPEWVKGPPVALREKAGAGFAKRYGRSVDDLEERDGFLGVEVPGKPLRERLEAIVGGLAFGKSMVWEAGGLRFARPVRWLLAKLDAETVLGETSFGHRFTAGAVEVPSAGEYLEALRAAGVEPDQAERRRLILEGLPDGWRDPLGKLEEVVHLVEWPTVLEGRFDERFLALPQRVIESTMQDHQRYFPLGGDRFAFVANGGEPDVVRAGNERVLNARLEDAAFTFERDKTVGIDGLVSQLGAITFLAGAGSFADKTERLVALVEQLGGGDTAREAAQLAKADQAAELVREFPELEGYIGAEYARLAGRPEAVCRAIEEQYLPDGAEAPLPDTEAGRILAAADKLDHLQTAFARGLKPTGSRDPYGLRRAAIGLCRLAIEGGVPVELSGEVAEFVGERLEGLLDLPVEFVRAARGSGARDLRTIAELAQTLHRLEEDVLTQLHTAYTRAARLAGKAEAEAAPELRHDLLVEDAEREVAEALQKARPFICAGVGNGDVLGALSAGARLGPPLDRFFDEVLVMAEEPDVRANRLRLLLDVRETLKLLGDFSQLPL